MPIISPLFIPLFTIEEVVLNKDTGLPLSGGVVRFFRDAQRVTPKDVFTISGTYPFYTFTDVGAVFTLGIAGDFVDGSGNPFVPYAYPYDAAGAVDLYYVTVESEGGIAQFTRQAVPYIPSGDIPPEDRINTENELSNPQFVEVNFAPGITTLSLTGTNTVTQVAPGWDIITSGTDTLTLERLEPTAANVPTNPPFTLRIQAGAGFGASVTLRQRLLNTVSLLRGEFISGTLTAAILGGGGSAFSMVYAPSTGTPTTIITSTSISTDGAYHTIVGNAAIPQQANPAASTGYTDINIVIPTSRNIAITSIQIVGVATSVDVPFDQQTADRQKDHLFHYYENSILTQSKETLLTGWNFGLNPWQFRSTVQSNVANNTYTADQTILVQQNYVATATGNNVSIGQGLPSDENKGLKVAAVTAANKFAIIQYIDPKTIAPYWDENLSSLVKQVAVSSPTHNTSVKFKMRLIYRTSLPPTISQTEPIASWTNIDGSDPVFAGGWTAIKPLNDPTYTASPNVENTFSFDQFQIPSADAAGNSTLGIVLYTTTNMVQTATADQIIFNSISLVHNDFAIESSVETWDESLRKCQFYYEKSYDNATLPGTSTVTGDLDRVMGSSITTGNAYAAPFQFEYNSVKRAIPTTTFYSTVGTINRVSAQLWTAGVGSLLVDTLVSTFWVLAESGTKSIGYLPISAAAIATSAPNDNVSSVIRFQFVADARLGI